MPFFVNKGIKVGTQLGIKTYYVSICRCLHGSQEFPPRPAKVSSVDVIQLTKYKGTADHTQCLELPEVPQDI